MADAGRAGASTGETSGPTVRPGRRRVIASLGVVGVCVLLLGALGGLVASTGLLGRHLNVVQDPIENALAAVRAGAAAVVPPRKFLGGASADRQPRKPAEG